MKRKKTPDKTRHIFAMQLTSKDISKVLAMFNHAKYRMIAELQLYMGFRSKEACFLLTTQINPETNTIAIWEQKNNQPDILPIPPILRKKLYSWKEEQEMKDTELMFPSQTCRIKAIDRKTYQQQVKFAFWKAGFTQPYIYSQNGTPRYKYGSHTFRHIWAIKMIENGATPLELQELGRWKSMMSVYPYYKICRQRHSEIVNKLEAFPEYDLKQHMSKENRKLYI